MRYPLFFATLGIILIGCAFKPSWAMALTPDQTVVIANQRANDSVVLARYYMQQRGIPKENLITVRTTQEEISSRATYEEEIAAPVAKALKTIQAKKRIRCLVTIYGIPLKILATPLSIKDAEKVDLLKKKQKIIQKDLQTAQDSHKNSLKKEGEHILQQLKKLQRFSTRAAVDSELALVRVPDYPRDGWLPNPYFLGFQKQKTLLDRDDILIVSRLDGPTPGVVRRLIDDALLVEKTGLQGTAYFDARWQEPETTKKHKGYALYDASLHKAAHALQQEGMSVILDAQSSLFPPDSCDSVALYSGWYSFKKYVNAFEWQQGSVGYHIASGECSTLKRPHFQGWCKRMLEEGIAATIGPVYEPYVQAFPLPDLFFTILHEGYLTLGETYLISLPFLSWQMVLIGDPLYKPFHPVKKI